MLTDATFAAVVGFAATDAEVEELIKTYKELKKAQEDLATTKNPLAAAQDKFSKIEAQINNFFAAAQTAVEGKYARSILSAERQIEAKQKEVEAAQKNVSAIQDTIEGIQSKIDQKEVEIETQVTRELRIFEDQITKLEEEISKTFDKPISVLQEESSDLANDLTLMDNAADAINKKYDAQQDALTKISELNQNLIAQEKQRISLADALSQGDISAAAQMAQDIRSTGSEDAASAIGDSLDLAKEQEIANLRNASGLTRLEIERRQFAITQEIYNLEEKREAVEAAIAKIKLENIEPLEQRRKAILLEIRKFEDEIYNITNGVGVSKNNNLLLANQEFSAAQALLEKEKEKLQVILDAQTRDLAYLEDLKVQWAEVSGEIAKAEVAATNFDSLLVQAVTAALQIIAEWGNIAGATDGAALAASSYALIMQILADEIITDEEIKLLAAAWGISYNAANKYLQFALALNDGVLSAAEIAALGVAWGMTEQEVLQYADFVKATIDGKLSDAEIAALGVAWGMTASQVAAYISQMGSPVLYTGTTLTPGEQAAIGWKNASAALLAYLALLATKPTTVTVPGTPDKPSADAATSPCPPGMKMGLNDKCIPDPNYKTPEQIAAEAQAAQSAAAADAYAAALAAGNTNAAAIAAAGVTPSAVAAAENGIIGAASIAAQLAAAVARQKDEAEKARIAAMQAAMLAASAGSGVGGGGNNNAVAMSSGGMVMPKYFAAGGYSRGTDTVPAMLTPGEFVMNKDATSRFGPILELINNSKFPSVMPNNEMINKPNPIFDGSMMRPDVMPDREPPGFGNIIRGRFGNIIGGRFGNIMKPEPNPGFNEPIISPNPGFGNITKPYPGFDGPITKPYPGFNEPIISPNPGFGNITKPYPGFNEPIISPNPGFEKPIMRPNPGFGNIMKPYVMPNLNSEEFFMSKYGVSNYGSDKMKAINTGTPDGEKVYNYNLSVNVKSDANPNDIARVVMTQIKQIDSQRIRTQRP